MGWQPTRVYDLVPGARMNVNAFECPLLKTIAKIDRDDRGAFIYFTDGSLILLKDPEAEVFACMPDYP